MKFAHPERRLPSVDQFVSAPVSGRLEVVGVVIAGAR